MAWALSSYNANVWISITVTGPVAREAWCKSSLSFCLYSIIELGLNDFILQRFPETLSTVIRQSQPSDRNPSITTAAQTSSDQRSLYQRTRESYMRSKYGT